MRFLNKIVFTFVTVIIGITSGFSQENDFIRDEGEVVEGEFVISKELEITLPTAQRIFEKVPPDEINQRETEPIQYTFGDYTPELPDIATRLRVLKLKDSKVTQGPASFLKIGIGNYLTPLFQLSLNSGPDKQSNYGMNINHLSSINGPVDKNNSGDSHTHLGLFGKYIGTKASISGDLGFNREGYHFYGYEPGMEVNRDTIQQNFNDINLGFSIKNASAETPFQYRIFGRAHYIADKFDASEFGFKGGVKGNYQLGESMRASLLLEYIFNAYKNPESINRSLVRVHPNFEYTISGINLDLGFRILNHNDTLNNKNNTRIYPVLKASYDFSDDFTAYATLDGDVEEVTYQSTVRDNPYVNSNLPLNHTIKNIDLNVGIKGKLVQFLAYNAGVRSAFYKNMYFYINDPEEFNKFSIIYDEGSMHLFQVYAALSYMKSNVMGSTLSLKYNGYNTDDVAKAWHKPKFELDYSLWYNLYNKVKLSADFFVLSGIQAVDRRVVTQETVKLDPAVDLNLKIDYTLSERYGAFVSVNNILNSNYERFYKYQTRGLLAIVGVSVNF